MEPSYDIENHTANFIERELFKLGEGASFGELALINESSRSCSIKALDYVQLISLSKEQFLKNFGDIVTKNIEKIERFLNSCLELRRRFDETQIHLLASKLMIKKYPPSFNLQREGEPVDTFYLLGSGSVIIQQVVYKSHIEPSGYNKLIKKIYESLPEEVVIQIRVVQEPGYTFSVQDIVSKDKSHFRVSTDLPSVLYSCSTYDLKKFFGLQNIKNLPVEHVRKITDTKTLEHHLDRLLWAQFKEENDLRLEEMKKFDEYCRTGAQRNTFFFKHNTPQKTALADRVQSYFEKKVRENNYYTMAVDQFLSKKPKDRLKMTIRERLEEERAKQLEVDRLAQINNLKGILKRHRSLALQLQGVREFRKYPMRVDRIARGIREELRRTGATEGDLEEGGLDELGGGLRKKSPKVWSLMNQNCVENGFILGYKRPRKASLRNTRFGSLGNSKSVTYELEAFNPRDPRTFKEGKVIADEDEGFKRGVKTEYGFGKKVGFEGFGGFDGGPRGSLPAHLRSLDGDEGGKVRLPKVKAQKGSETKLPIMMKSGSEVKLRTRPVHLPTSDGFKKAELEYNSLRSSLSVEKGLKAKRGQSLNKRGFQTTGAIRKQATKHAKLKKLRRKPVKSVTSNNLKRSKKKKKLGQNSPEPTKIIPKKQRWDPSSRLIVPKYFEKFSKSTYSNFKIHANETLESGRIQEMSKMEADDLISLINKTKKTILPSHMRMMKNVVNTRKEITDFYHTDHEEKQRRKNLMLARKRKKDMSEVAFEFL